MALPAAKRPSTGTAWDVEGELNARRAPPLDPMPIWPPVTEARRVLSRLNGRGESRLLSEESNACAHSCRHSPAARFIDVGVDVVPPWTFLFGELAQFSHHRGRS